MSDSDFGARLPIRGILKKVGSVITRMAYRPYLEFEGATIADDPTYVDPISRVVVGKTTVTITGGEGGLSPIADQRLFGNVSGASAVPSAMTAAQARTLLGVESGATAGAVSSDSATIDFSGAGTSGSPLTGGVKAGSITAAMCAADVATQTELDAVSAAVTTEATTRAAADTALDGRLDTIEASGVVATGAAEFSGVGSTTIGDGTDVLIDGVLDMQGSSLVGLPDPTGAQEPVTLAYLQANAPIVHARTGSVDFSPAGQAWADLDDPIDVGGASTAALYELTLQVDHGTLDAAEDILPAAGQRVIHVIARRNASNVCTFHYATGESAAPWNVADVEFQLIDATGDWQIQVRKDVVGSYTGTAQVRAWARVLGTIPWTSDTTPTLELFGGGGGSYPAATLTTTGTIADAGTVRLPNGATVQARNAANSGNVQALEVTGSNQVKLGSTSNVTEINGSATTIKSVADIILKPTGDVGDTLKCAVVSSECKLTSTRAIRIVSAPGTNAILESDSGAYLTGANVTLTGSNSITLTAGGNAAIQAGNICYGDGVNGLTWSCNSASPMTLYDRAVGTPRHQWFVRSDVPISTATTTTGATFSPTARPATYEVNAKLWDPATGKARVWVFEVEALLFGGAAVTSDLTALTNMAATRTVGSSPVAATLTVDTSGADIRIRFITTDTTALTGIVTARRRA